MICDMAGPMGPMAMAPAGAEAGQVAAPAGLVLAAARAQRGQCMVASGVVEACGLCGVCELCARCCASEMRDWHVTEAAVLLVQAAAWQEEDNRSACEARDQEMRVCLPERIAGMSAQAAQLRRDVAMARVAMDARAAADLGRVSEVAPRVLAADLRRVSEAASRMLAARSGEAALARGSRCRRGCRRVRRGARRRKLGLAAVGCHGEVPVHGVGGVAAACCQLEASEDALCMCADDESDALFDLRVRDG